MRRFKLTVHVPLTHTNAVRESLANAGAGVIGNYTHCSFSVRGTGRFKGNEHAKPHIGVPDLRETVEEEAISVSNIPHSILKDVIAAMLKVHPYEEPAFEVLELIDTTEL